MTMLSLLAITTTAPNYLAGALTACAVAVLCLMALTFALLTMGPVEGGQP